MRNFPRLGTPIPEALASDYPRRTPAFAVNFAGLHKGAAQNRLRSINGPALA